MGLWATRISKGYRMLSDMPFIYGTVAVGRVVPFLSVVAVVRRVFCRIKSSLKLFFFKKYDQGFFRWRSCLSSHMLVALVLLGS